MTERDEATIEELMQAHGFPMDDDDPVPAWLGEIPEAYALDVGRIAADLATKPSGAIEPIECGFSLCVMAYHFRTLLPPGAAYFLVCVGASMLKDLTDDGFTALMSAQPGQAGAH